MKNQIPWVPVILLVMSIGFAAFSATPEKPYPDLSDGDTLTPTHYNGMLSTLYSWAQVANASITQLLTGAGITGTLTASATSAVSSTAMPLIWDSLGSQNLAMTGSGTMQYMLFSRFTGLNKKDMGNFFISGSMYSNGSNSALFDDDFFKYNFIGSASDWNLLASVPIPGHLAFFASVPASVSVKLDLIKFEGHY